MLTIKVAGPKTRTISYSVARALIKKSRTPIPTGIPIIIPRIVSHKFWPIKILP